MKIGVTVCEVVVLGYEPEVVELVVALSDVVELGDGISEVVELGVSVSEVVGLIVLCPRGGFVLLCPKCWSSMMLSLRW